ncbi:MAG TPA: site-2 protease family protein [Terriglobia bacterium]|nr:site-2 protease family protein [Terriglobia bacterium]
MRAQIKLGRIFGVEIGVHYSWIVIALLIVLSLSAHFRSGNPDWSDTTVWATALITAVLFFVTILIHELAHSIVARLHGLPVRSIVLFALGGVSQIEKESPTASAEFWIGIAGPLASVAIGILCLAGALLTGWSILFEPATPVAAVLLWLGYINLLLAAFNMIPGFPLDGGRVLRSVIWWITGARSRATRIAARVGEVVSYGFILIGLVRFFTGGGLGGLWISFIGWFLLDAARATQAQTGVLDALSGVLVGSVMSRDYATVDGYSNLRGFADEHLLQSGRRCYIVIANGQVAGLITPQDVRQIPAAQWPYKTVSDVMRPMDQLRVVSVDTPVIQALEIMGRDDVNQLPVIVDGTLEGIISRANILQLLQTRSELRT